METGEWWVFSSVFQWSVFIWSLKWTELLNVLYHSARARSMGEAFGLSVFSFYPVYAKFSEWMSSDKARSCKRRVFVEHVTNQLITRICRRRLHFGLFLDYQTLSQNDFSTE